MYLAKKKMHLHQFNNQQLQNCQALVHTEQALNEFLHKKLKCTILVTQSWTHAQE